MKHRSLAAVAQTAASVAMPSEAPAAELATGRQSYVDQLADKTAVVKARFANLSIPEIEVFSSAEQHYRMRHAKLPLFHRSAWHFWGWTDRLVLLVQV